MTDTSKSDGLNYRRMVPLAIIVVVAITAYILFRDQLSWGALVQNYERLVEWRDTNYLSLSIIYVLTYILMVAFSLPGALIATLAGGFLFGLIPGLPFTVFAATTGAVLIFLAARMGLGDYLSAKIDSSSGAVKRMSEGLRENEISVLFLLRLVPAVPFFAANLIPALVGVKLRNFVFTTALGIIPGSAVFTWVGTGIGAALESGAQPNLGIIWQWNILGPILALCALAALPIVIKLVRRNKEENN